MKIRSNNSHVQRSELLGANFEKRDYTSFYLNCIDLSADFENNNLFQLKHLNRSNLYLEKTHRLSHRPSPNPTRQPFQPRPNSPPFPSAPPARNPSPPLQPNSNPHIHYTTKSHPVQGTPSPCGSQSVPHPSPFPTLLVLHRRWYKVSEHTLKKRAPEYTYTIRKGLVGRGATHFSRPPDLLS